LTLCTPSTSVLRDGMAITALAGPNGATPAPTSVRAPGRSAPCASHRREPDVAKCLAPLPSARQLLAQVPGEEPVGSLARELRDAGVPAQVGVQRLLPGAEGVE